jgi:hypothetical protein
MLISPIGRAGAQIGAHRCKLEQKRLQKRNLKGTPCHELVCLFVRSLVHGQKVGAKTDNFVTTALLPSKKNAIVCDTYCMSHGGAKTDNFVTTACLQKKCNCM